jgi:DNA-directed RNA polymerase specialized sigma subunit
MEIKANLEREADNSWLVTVPYLGNLRTSSKRLDKIKEQILTLVEKESGESRCDIILKLEGEFPEILADLEKAHSKMSEAHKLQEEASLEVRKVVANLRDQGLTMRDIAVLLGITPQRVQQLAPCNTK